MYICIYIYLCPPYTCITIYAHLMGKTGSSEFENVQKIISPKQQQGRLQRHPQVSNFLQGFEAEIFPVVMHIHLVLAGHWFFPPQKKVGQVVSSHFPLVVLKRQKKKRTRRSVETAGVLVGVFKCSPWHVLKFPSQRLSQFYLCKYAGFTS